MEINVILISSAVVVAVASAFAIAMIITHADKLQEKMELAGKDAFIATFGD